MFKAVLRALKVAPGAKAAAVPTRREAIASFMVLGLGARGGIKTRNCEETNRRTRFRYDVKMAGQSTHCMFLLLSHLLISLFHEDVSGRLT